MPLLNGFLSKEMMLEEAAIERFGAAPTFLFAALGDHARRACSQWHIRFVTSWHVFLGPEREDYPANATRSWFWNVGGACIFLLRSSC